MNSSITLLYSMHQELSSDISSTQPAACNVWYKDKILHTKTLGFKHSSMSYPQLKSWYE